MGCTSKIHEEAHEDRWFYCSMRNGVLFITNCFIIPKDSRVVQSCGMLLQLIYLIYLEISVGFEEQHVWISQAALAWCTSSLARQTSQGKRITSRGPKNWTLGPAWSPLVALIQLLYPPKPLPESMCNLGQGLHRKLASLFLPSLFTEKFGPPKNNWLVEIQKNRQKRKLVNNSSQPASISVAGCHHGLDGAIVQTMHHRAVNSGRTPRVLRSTHWQQTLTVCSVQLWGWPRIGRYTIFKGWSELTWTDYLHAKDLACWARTKLISTSIDKKASLSSKTFYWRRKPKDTATYHEAPRVSGLIWAKYFFCNTKKTKSLKPGIYVGNIIKLQGYSFKKGPNMLPSTSDVSFQRRKSVLFPHRNWHV